MLQRQPQQPSATCPCESGLTARSSPHKPESRAGAPTPPGCRDEGTPALTGTGEGRGCGGVTRHGKGQHQGGGHPATPPPTAGSPQPSQEPFPRGWAPRSSRDPPQALFPLSPGLPPRPGLPLRPGSPLRPGFP